MTPIPHHRANKVQTARRAIAKRGVLRKEAARHGFDFDREDRGILHIHTAKKTSDHATGGDVQRSSIPA